MFNVTTMGRGGKKPQRGAIHLHLPPKSILKILTWSLGFVESQPGVCGTQQSSQRVVLPITDPQPLSARHRILQGILTSYQSCVNSLSWRQFLLCRAPVLSFTLPEITWRIPVPWRQSHSQKDEHKHFLRTTVFLQREWHLGSGTLSKLCYFV